MSSYKEKKDPVICPMCRTAGQKSKVVLVGTMTEVSPGDYWDEEGHYIPSISKKLMNLRCSFGHVFKEDEK